MDAERAEAIVLRLRPVTESSLIVTWFTREFGKLKTIAKGARRPKSPLRGKIDLFYVDEIVFLRSRRSELHILKECFLENPHAALRTTVKTVTAASYCCELVDIATEAEDANPKIFQLLSSVLDALEQTCDAVLPIWFELQLLAAAGWAPKWPGRSASNRVLASLAAASLTGAQRVRLTPQQVRATREAVWRFWDEQVSRQPRSRKLLVGMPL